MREIPLSRGKVALVDADDYEWLSIHKWHYTSAGYANSSKLGYMHRFVLGLTESALVVDHINGNKLDNRRANLRLATRAQNVMNQRTSAANSSGYKGVSWDKDVKKWRAYLTYQKKRVYLGLYEDAEDAAQAYNTKATELFGEFAFHNVIPRRMCA